MTSSEQSGPLAPAAPIWGVNHIKLPVKDLAATRAFYTDVLGLEHIAAWDHVDKSGRLFAQMLAAPQGTDRIVVELRLDEAHAAAQQRWDPVTWGVRTRADLEAWRARFGERGVPCSRVFTGLKAWVLCALDPDGKIVRLYCDEEHEWTTDFDHDDFWL